jgi:hypothetical protein
MVLRQIEKANNVGSKCSIPAEDALWAASPPPGGQQRKNALRATTPAVPPIACLPISLKITHKEITYIYTSMGVWQGIAMSSPLGLPTPYAYVQDSFFFTVSQRPRDLITLTRS